MLKERAPGVRERRCFIKGLESSFTQTNLIRTSLTTLEENICGTKITNAYPSPVRCPQNINTMEEKSKLFGGSV